MMVSIDQWRAATGTFNCHKRVTRCVSFSNNVSSSHFLSMMLYYVVNGANIIILACLCIFTFLLCHGDIESNLGPKRIKPNCLSICYWKLNSISAHNFSKIAQLKACNSIYKHDLICLSETYLDLSAPLHDNSLQIEGYNLVREDHPNDLKRGGVYIYYRESLPFGVMSIPYLKEAVLLELVKNKKIFVSVVYRSTSQTNDEFNQFLLNFEKMLLDINQRKPYLTLVMGILMQGLLLDGLMTLTQQKEENCFH